MKSIAKRLIAIAVIASVLGLAASGCCEGNPDATSFYSQGLEVVQILSEMIESETYVESYTQDAAIKSLIQERTDGDYSSPKAVYAISLPETARTAMTLLVGLELGSVPDDLRSYVAGNLFRSLCSVLNGKSSSQSLAAASVCTFTKTFVDANASGDAIYLYTYEDTAPVAVTFTVGEDQSVLASGTFMMGEGFACGSADEVKASFDAAYSNMISMDVAEVQPGA